MWPNPQKTANLVTFTEEILNGKVYHAVETLLRSRFVNQIDDTSYPADCVHIFAKNKPVEEHNRERLN